jgi:hypothetical protein
MALFWKGGLNFVEIKKTIWFDLMAQLKENLQGNLCCELLKWIWPEKIKAQWKNPWKVTATKMDYIILQCFFKINFIIILFLWQKVWKSLNLEILPMLWI